MQRKLIYILLLFLNTFVLQAQDIEFTATAPNYVRVGEQFQVQFSTTKNIDDFSPPSFEGFQFLGGPMQSSSSSSSYVNGKWVHNTTVSFIYVLKAVQPGNFTIQPAKAVYKKNEINSNSISIEVVGAATQSASQQQGATASGSQSPAVSEQTGDDIFVSLILDKKSAYVGEQITAWVKVYTKIKLTAVDMQSFKGPEFSSFYKENVVIPQLTNLEREKVGNDIYLSGTLQKFILYPQKSGKITIDPFDLTVEVQKQSKQSRSIFDDFFGPSYASQQLSLRSKPVILNIKSLPEPQPEGYTGAVGQFSINGSLNTSTVRENDAISFKISLSGKGNLKLIENIHSELPSALEVYDPVIKSIIDKSGYSGTKIFEITAIPRHAGTFDIKPFSLSYFDPSTATYKTVQTQDFTIDVAKGDGDSSRVIISNLSKEDVELLGSDIRYIKATAQLNKSGKYLVSSFWYYIIYLLIIASLIAYFLIKREQIRQQANVFQVRHKRATRVANKRLKTARLLLKQGNLDKYYEELSRALWGYLSDKLGIPVSSLSCDAAKNEMTERKIESQLIDEFLALISDCEFARYAPGAVTQKPDEIYEQAVKILSQVDQNL